MSRIFIILLLIGFSVFPVFAQNEETILTIDDTKVTKAEFERIYKKNNTNLFNEEDKKSPRDYLKLFINFKLKVIEAQHLKMDTDSVFIAELAGYRKELAAPYLTDVSYNEQMVHETHERMLKEINASHILFRIPENATREAEQAIYEKALDVRQEILDGKDFNEAAVEYSQDPSAQSNRGNLNYFTAFQMVSPFENAAFKTKVGEISEPVRTSFGYHLIKVHDIRKNRGEVRVAHIMKMFPDGISEAGKMKLKNEIDSIYTLLQNGADFSETAKKYSDDKRSGQYGGEMPWFTSGRMIPEFAEPAFNIPKPGDCTKPVETQFGYHIIKKLDQRPVKSFEEAKADIENRIKNDPARSSSSKHVFVEKLKKEYAYSEELKNIDKLRSLPVDGEFENLDMKLFTIEGNDYRLESLVNYIHEQNINTGNCSKVFDQWVENEITNLENSKLEKKYPEFRYLLQEFHDGILLFNI